MLAVRTVQTLAEWQALEPVWQALVKSDSRVTLCNTWEWNDAWVQQFWQPHFEFRIFIVERRNAQSVEALALLPLYRNRKTAEVLMLGTGEPEASEVASEYLDLLLDESRSAMAEIAPLLLSALQALRCSALRFLNCLASSRLLQLVATLPRADKTVTGRQYGIALSQSLAEVMQQFSYKQRKNGQLLLNRFDKNPALTCEILIDADASAPWQQLQQLHQSDWTARQKQGAFASADFIRFHELLQQRGETLQARFAVLRHEQEILAIHYYYQFREWLYYYQSGTVKDRFQQYSPGKMLHMLAFRQLAGSGLYYDFMKGAVQGGYKAAMCPEGELFYQVVIYGGGVAARVRWLWVRLKRRIRRNKTVAAKAEPANSAGSD
jgi:CelD/BcsL family acetyltransferase involved in cellulose biosynthesis